MCAYEYRTLETQKNLERICSEQFKFANRGNNHPKGIHLYLAIKREYLTVTGKTQKIRAFFHENYQIETFGN